MAIVNLDLGGSESSSTTSTWARQRYVNMRPVFSETGGNRTPVRVSPFGGMTDFTVDTGAGVFGDAIPFDEGTGTFDRIAYTAGNEITVEGEVPGVATSNLNSIAYNGTVFATYDDNGEVWFYEIGSGIVKGNTIDPSFSSISVIDVSFKDGYFLYLTQDSIYSGSLSTVNKGRDLSLLDFVDNDSDSDRNVAVETHGDYVYVFGRSSIEIYQNRNLPNFPFARIKSAQIDIGCYEFNVAGTVASKKVAKTRDAIYFVGADFNDYLGVYSIHGVTTRKISSREMDSEPKVTNSGIFYSSICAFTQDGRDYVAASLGKKYTQLFDDGEGNKTPIQATGEATYCIDVSETNRMGRTVYFELSSGYQFVNFPDVPGIGTVTTFQPGVWFPMKIVGNKVFGYRQYAQYRSSTDSVIGVTVNTNGGCVLYSDARVGGDKLPYGLPSWFWATTATTEISPAGLPLPFSFNEYSVVVPYLERGVSDGISINEFGVNMDSDNYRGNVPDTQAENPTFDPWPRVAKDTLFLYLSYSDDGGYTYSTPKKVSVLDIRICIKRLGRINQSRLFKISNYLNNQSGLLRYNTETESYPEDNTGGFIFNIYGAWLDIEGLNNG